MPRKSRQKYPEAVYHIMCRSMSEILLFRDGTDKDYYLRLLKRYIENFKCSIYAFCLMDNHLHIQLDPKGFDVSKFMHCVNTAYVRYYNTKYQRHGPLFQGRFESRILDTEKYNLAVSAYIHNNPKDIIGFTGKEEDYQYSSYGIYLCIRKDRFKILDKSFIIGLFHANNTKFVKEYFVFASHQREIENLKEIEDRLSTSVEYEYMCGREIILRELPPSNAISFISSKLMISDKNSTAVKGSRRLIEYRAFCAYVLRVLGGLSYKEICRDMHNITISGCSRLCEKGYKLLNSENTTYSTLFNELVDYAA